MRKGSVEPLGLSEGIRRYNLSSGLLFHWKNRVENE